MNIFSAFKEAYPDDGRQISINLGDAICKNNSTEVNNIIGKYFSTNETKKFLEGIIAYQSNENGGGEKGSFWSPAYLASACGNHNIIKTIIETCGNPNLAINPDLYDYTLLMDAADKGDRRTIELLISLGANPNFGFSLDSGHEVTALGVAILGGFQKAAELLISHGAHFTINEAMAAVEANKQFPPYIEDLIRKNPEIFSRTARNDRRTILHHACLDGKERIVRWLVENGVDINAPDAENRTPLCYANYTNQRAISEYLKSKGALLEASENSSDQENKISVKESSKIKEITHLIERFELIEDKLSVRFEGVYCTQVKRVFENQVDFLVEVNFDVIGTEEKLGNSFSPTFSAYNTSRQLISTATTFIDNDRFLGIESIKMELVCQEAPTKLRLYPAISF